MASNETDQIVPEIIHCTGNNNCNDDTDADNSREMDLMLYFYLISPAVTLFYAGIFVVGVIGNFLVCYVVAKYKDMRDNIFHIFLA